MAGRSERGRDRESGLARRASHNLIPGTNGCTRGGHRVCDYGWVRGAARVIRVVTLQVPTMNPLSHNLVMTYTDDDADIVNADAIDYCPEANKRGK